MPQNHSPALCWYNTDATAGPAHGHHTVVSVSGHFITRSFTYDTYDPHHHWVICNYTVICAGRCVGCALASPFCVKNWLAADRGEGLWPGVVVALGINMSVLLKHIYLNPSPIIYYIKFRCNMGWVSKVNSLKPPLGAGTSLPWFRLYNNMKGTAN